jgi:UDP-N-acetylglucosamine diphosphorylase/glucosamine-1-phosphate N-acetyltransferase
MNLVLSDCENHLKFAPLSFSRPIGNLRMGILTNDERWKTLIPESTIYYETKDYLSFKFQTTSKGDITINAAIIPTEELVEVIKCITDGDQLMQGAIFIAKRGIEIENRVNYLGELILIENRWDIFEKNDQVLRLDFELLTKNRKSAPISKSNTIIGDEKLVFVEEGASVEAAVLNTKTGPIYVGKNAEIMEGSIVRGPLAMCESSALKMGAKVYGATTLGPHCKVGGEVSNVVFQACSNKGHDGFLGNSVIGEWCNIGADTNSSNLKNNYSKVNAYSYETESFEKTEIQFMGLIMGDHSKCGINTMFNTATVVGFSANIYGGDFPPKIIPSFSWGGSDGFEKFDLKKAIEAATAMMGRRKIDFTEGDQKIFEKLSL